MQPSPCDATTPATRLEAMQQTYDDAADTPSRLRVLSIEGSDPIGGAGTMADMKAFAAHGVFGYAAMTSVLAQNTRGVTDIVNVEPAFLIAQLRAISEDAPIDAMKIGMLGTPELIEAVYGWLTDLLNAYDNAGRPRPVIVLDPVMYAKSGDALLVPEAERALTSLMPLVDIITPNAPELAKLADQPEATNSAQLSDQANTVAGLYHVCVYAKGGSLALQGNPDCPDVLVVPSTKQNHDNQVTVIEGKSIPTINVHGAGDALSSTLAALRPQYDSWLETARQAKTWMNGAIAAADGLHIGAGHGPIDFTWRHAPTAKSFSEDYWHRAAPIRERIRTMPFITRMLDGSLEPTDFAYYLHQDDLYMHDYTSLLALASSRAARVEDRAFFAQAAYFGVQEGLNLHHVWLAGHGFDTDPQPMSDQTAAYIGHEHRIADTLCYQALVSVVMPCYWVYSFVGSQMRRQVSEHDLDLESHPYGSWIRMYADTAFAEKTLQELRICDRLARQSSIEDYELMMDAALRSTEHEYRFFNQALHRDRSLEDATHQDKA